MTPTAFATVAATVFVAAVTPGPAATAIVARALADGLRPALALSAGVLTGDLVFLALAAAGMAAAARSMGELFTVLKIAGVAYLLWSGVALWRARPRAATVREAAHEGHFWRNYGAGILLMVGHVQAILFYAALPAVEARLADGAALVRGAAVWALARLAPPQLLAALRARHAPAETDPDVAAEWRLTFARGPGEEGAGDAMICRSDVHPEKTS